MDHVKDLAEANSGVVQCNELVLESISQLFSSLQDENEFEEYEDEHAYQHHQRQHQQHQEEVDHDDPQHHHHHHQQHHHHQYQHHTQEQEDNEGCSVSPYEDESGEEERGETPLPHAPPLLSTMHLMQAFNLARGVILQWQPQFWNPNLGITLKKVFPSTLPFHPFLFSSFSFFFSLFSFSLLILFIFPRIFSFF